jgi:hypothetical protein
LISLHVSDAIFLVAAWNFFRAGGAFTMSMFDSITKPFESLADNLMSGATGIASEASLIDPGANQIIGRMNQTNNMDLFPSADSLLGGLPNQVVGVAMKAWEVQNPAADMVLDSGLGKEAGAVAGGLAFGDPITGAQVGGLAQTMHDTGDQYFSSQITQVVEAPANDGMPADYTNPSRDYGNVPGDSGAGGGILGGLNDLSKGISGLVGEVSNLFKCSGVSELFGKGGLDSFLGGGSGGSGGSSGGISGLFGM